MTSARSRRAATIGLALATLCSSSLAQPSGHPALASEATVPAFRGLRPPNVWSLVANPDAFAEEQACQTAEAVLDMFAPAQPSDDANRQLQAALDALERAHALEARDVRLKYYLGRILMHLHDDERAISVFEGALSEAPDHPMAVDAFFSVAVSYAKVGRRTDEIAAYGEYLRRETDPLNRARGLSNRAESELALEQYTEALWDYRRAIDLAPEDSYIHWGYAVALDRTGDPAASINEAKIAIRLDPLDEQLHRPSVFFVPGYDRYWYEGLGAMVRATVTDDAASASLWWETARARWLVYEAAAGPSDRWYSLAKAHRGTCERALTKAKSSGSRKRDSARARP